MAGRTVFHAFGTTSLAWGMCRGRLGGLLRGRIGVYKKIHRFSQIFPGGIDGEKVPPKGQKGSQEALFFEVTAFFVGILCFLLLRLPVRFDHKSLFLRKAVFALRTPSFDNRN